MNYFAHPTAVIDENCSIGTGTKIWHFTHVMSDALIGMECNLGQNVVIESKVILGNKVRIQNNVSVHQGVICEDEVFLGPGVVLTNVINPRSAISRKHEFRQTIIRKGATVGANATIICGIEIGHYAFIGAGAVVTRSVKSYALVKGNPARQTGWMSEYGHKLVFDQNGKATCPESGQLYQLEEMTVSKIDA